MGTWPLKAIYQFIYYNESRGRKWVHKNRSRSDLLPNLMLLILGDNVTMFFFPKSYLNFGNLTSMIFVMM